MTLTDFGLAGSYLLLSSLKVNFRRNHNHETYIDIVIHAMLDRKEYPCISIDFFNCVDFRVLNFVNASSFLLDIEDISHWQNEGVKFLVRDTEEEIFSFKCLRVNLFFTEDSEEK